MLVEERNNTQSAGSSKSQNHVIANNGSKCKHQTIKINVMDVPEVPLPPPSSNSNPLKFLENA
jgi:hypothetical protein